MYDAAVGRFTGVDPLAEKFAELSVYNYAGNSPILNNDLWGLQAIRYDYQFNETVTGGYSIDEQMARHAAVAEGAIQGALMSMPVDELALVVVTAGKIGRLEKAGRAIGRFGKSLLNKVGNIFKTGEKAQKVADAEKAVDNVDYIGFPDGTTVHKSQSKMEKSLKDAGFESKDLKGADGTVKGREYKLDDMNVRAIEPDGTNPRRSSFENKNGQPSQPGGQQVKTHETKGMTKSERREYVRQRTHAIQNQ